MMQSASIVAPSYSNLPPTRVTLPHNLSWQEKTRQALWVQAFSKKYNMLGHIW